MKILAIGAHFDDVELGCGGSLLYYNSLGYKIDIFVATKSGYSNPQNFRVRQDWEALEEGRLSSRMIGAELYVGDIPTFEVEFSENLNSKILNLIETSKPNVIFTHWGNDVHHDHKILTQSVLHCAKNIDKILLYKSNWYQGDVGFNPNFFINISQFLDRKIELIKVHKSEFSRSNGKWEDFVRSTSKLNGLIVNCEYAEGFEVVKWLES